MNIVNMTTINNPNPFGNSTTDLYGKVISSNGIYTLVSAYSEDYDGTDLDSGKVYVYNSYTGEYVRTISNPNNFGDHAGDDFGYAIDICGDYCIIGAPGESDANTNSGSAYVFDLTDGSLVWTFTNPNNYGNSTSDRFGESVGITELYAVCGAPNEEHVDGNNSGTIYIYDMSDGSTHLTVTNPAYYSTNTDDNFGCSIDAFGGYACVGALGEDAMLNYNTGVVFIINLETGVTYRTLENPNEYSTGVDDGFGSQLRMNENYVCIQANGEDDIDGTYSGVVYVFEIGTGDLIHTIVNENAYSSSASDVFGNALALKQNFLLIGSALEDDEYGLNRGKAYLYDLISGDLLLTFDNPDTSSENQYFGSALDIEGKYIWIGASGNGTYSGKVYKYEIFGKFLQKIIRNPNEYGDATDWFGYSLDAYGDYFIVGSPNEDYSGGADSGIAHIYSTETGELYRTINNENSYTTETDDEFGFSVAIGENYYAVTARYESTPTLSMTGVIYIYNLASGTLYDTLVNPNSDTSSAQDNFGEIIKISGDYLVVSASGEDDGININTGVVYIYKISTKTVIHSLEYNYWLGSSDYFGTSLDVSGEICIIGAPYENSPDASSCGVVYIYNIVTGVKLDTIIQYPLIDDANFGAVVAIHDDVCLIRRSTAIGNYSVDIFNVTTGLYDETIFNPNIDTTSNLDYFAESIVMTDRYWFISSEEDTDGESGSGVLYVFDPISHELVDTIYNPNAFGTHGLDKFSQKIASTNSHLITTTHLEDTYGASTSGVAYLYHYLDTINTSVSSTILVNSVTAETLQITTVLSAPTITVEMEGDNIRLNW